MKNRKVVCLSCNNVFSNKSLNGIRCPFCDSINVEYLEGVQQDSLKVRDGEIRKYKMVIIIISIIILILLFTIEVDGALLAKVAYHTVVKWVISLIF